MSLSAYIIAACLLCMHCGSACDSDHVPQSVNETLKHLMTYDLASGECNGVGEHFNSISLYSHRNRILHFARLSNPVYTNVGYCAADFQYSDSHLKFHSRIFLCYDINIDYPLYGYPEMFLTWLDSMGKCDDDCTIGAPKEEYINQFEMEIVMGNTQHHTSISGFHASEYINRIIFWLKTIEERSVIFEFFKTSDDTVSMFGLNLSRTLGPSYTIFEKEHLYHKGARGADVTPADKITIVIPWLDAIYTRNITREIGDTTLKKTKFDLFIKGNKILEASHHFHHFKLLLDLMGDQGALPQTYSVDPTSVPLEEVAETVMQIENTTYNVNAEGKFNVSGVAVSNIINRIFKSNRFGRQSQTTKLTQVMTFNNSAVMNNNLTVTEYWSEEGLDFILSWKFVAGSFRWSHFFPDEMSKSTFKKHNHMKTYGVLEFTFPLDFIVSSYSMGYGYDEHDYHRIVVGFPTSEDKLHVTVKTKFNRRKDSNEWFLNVHTSNIWGLSKQVNLVLFRMKRLISDKPYKLQELITSSYINRDQIVHRLSQLLAKLKEVIKYVKESNSFEILSATFEDIFGQTFSRILEQAPPPIHTLGDMFKKFSETSCLSLLADLDSYPELFASLETYAINYINGFVEDKRMEDNVYLATFSNMEFMRELQMKIISTLTALLPQIDVENVSSFFKVVKYQWMEAFENWFFQI